MNDIYNLIYGGTAGIISRTITSPLERIKILRQNYPTKYNNSIPGIFLNIYAQQDGIYRSS